ncbi:unnamed protein product [Rhizoctonia solani]|uniref:Uncharacterized protein n=1 Tax=Rhizoctonia solani TaxID=456999 RepID=A0A8H3GWE1_9AGAM|nr:unnamed protein product [Rhizoctonia solani]
MLESSVTEIAVAAVTVAVGAAFYFGAPKPSEDGTVQPDQEQTSTKATSTSKKSGKKNKKKSLPGNIVRATSGEDTAAEESIPLKQQQQPQLQPKEKEVTPKPEVPPTSSTAAKKKKKKSKAPVSGIETTLAQAQTRPSASAYESSSANDGAWTRVETRRKAGKSGAVLSDGLTTSVTGTEDEADEQVKQPTLAERLLPAGRKTGVEDMLETPQYPDVARVMRVKPADEAQLAPGYSWGDYEDADENKVISMDDEETDEGGWGVVKSRKPKRTQTLTQASSQANSSTSDPSAPTKKQRQNAAKRDATKSAKAEAEEDRVAKLQAHKRALERERIAQAYAKPASGKGKASGGMTASVNEKGSLVWD